MNKTTLYTHLFSASVFSFFFISSKALAAALENPLAYTSIIDVLNAILDILLIFALPIIIFFIVFAGFKYVTARGNPGEIQKANQALTYALIGGAIVLGARVIGGVISATISTFTP